MHSQHLEFVRVIKFLVKLSTFEKRSRFFILFDRRTFPRLTTRHTVFLETLGRRRWSSQLEMDPYSFTKIFVTIQYHLLLSWGIGP